MDIKKAIADNLKNERIKRQIKQSEIAKILNIKENTYSQYENNKRNIPIELLVILADEYNTSVDYLVGRYKK